MKGLKTILIGSELIQSVSRCEGYFDSLKGFPDAINTAFPNIHLCIVHMLRNSMKQVPWKDHKPVAAHLKKSCQSITGERALPALDKFSDR